MDAIAELDQLTDSLTGTIAALRGLCGDTRKENADLVTAVSNVADGLSSIHSSIGGIRRVLAGLHTKSEGDSNEGTIPGIVARCGPKFRTGLDACVSTSGVVIEKLDVVVVLSEPEEDWGYESDWGSLAGSVRDVKSTLGNQLGDRDDILKRVGGVVGPLCAAWGIVLDVLDSNQQGKAHSSQQGLLESSAYREVFRRLEKSSTGLSSADIRGSSLPWTSLLKPFRLTSLLGRSNTSDDSPSASRPTLARTKTWPTMLLKSNIDPEVAEARKRSANIDKQIQVDSAVERKKCSLMLMHGSQEGKVVLTDSFAAVAREEADSPTVIDPSPIRESLLREANMMMSIARQARDFGDEWLGHLDALEARTTNESLLALDDEVVGLLMGLWSAESCKRSSLRRGRPEPYDKMVLETMYRAVAYDYRPTLADHRRFNQAIVRSFSFSFDPISVNLIDHGVLLSPGRRPRALLRRCIEDTTSYILPIDLAHYDTIYCENETLFQTGLCMLGDLTSKPIFRESHASVVVIFHGVREFRASLKEKQFSTIYPDFAGKNDPRDTISYMMKRVIYACGAKTKVYPYVGELSSRSTVRFILAAAKETMLHRALVEAGFF
ncbi:hypothetical protein B0T16DRAFT_459458 [Cercophora newfieldiana]|uniref:Uncharacterized protein n=1 Tax=Cercophora newfieldiana TaxID=92897 RepID=A0AA40CND9_9PEZI|nr:hypothetical protein B0T16DRAFT_459458 [Cercophora newfieldiana]